MRGDRAAASPSSATQVRGLTAPGWDDCMIDLEPAPLCVSGNKRRRRVRRERVLQQVSSKISWVSSSQLAETQTEQKKGPRVFSPSDWRLYFPIRRLQTDNWGARLTLTACLLASSSCCFAPRLISFPHPIHVTRSDHRRHAPAQQLMSLRLSSNDLHMEW